MKKNLSRALVALILLTSASNLIAWSKPKIHRTSPKQTHTNPITKKDVCESASSPKGYGETYYTTQTKCVGNPDQAMSCKQCHKGSNEERCNLAARKAKCWYQYRQGN